MSEIQNLYRRKDILLPIYLTKNHLSPFKNAVIDLTNCILVLNLTVRSK